MVTLHIVNHNVHRVLVNTGSSVDVLFCSAYDQMGLPLTILKLVDTPFYGFSSHNVRPHRGVELLVTAGSHSAQATVMSNFLIIDTPGAYNAIIERGGLRKPYKLWPPLTS